jgi:hypothetical protein
LKCKFCGNSLGPKNCYYDIPKGPWSDMQSLGIRNFEDWHHTGHCSKSCHDQDMKSTQKFIQELSKKD